MSSRGVVVVLGLSLAMLGGCSRQLGGSADDDAVTSDGEGSDGGEEGSSSQSGSSSTSDGSTGTSGFTSGGDCGSFLGCNDAPGYPFCDFWAQDCPAGEKCTPVVTTPGSSAWDAHQCVPIVDQPAGVGETCTLAEGPAGTDTCDGLSMCYDIDPDTLEGTCVGFCLGPRAAPTCEEPFAECRINGGGVLNLCLSPCNPLLSGECPSGQNCVAAFEGQELGGFICFPPAAEGMSGEECSCVNCCAAHHMCVTAAEYGPGCQFDLCCTEYCDVTDGSFTCAGLDQQCVALFPPGTPGLDSIGQCVVVP